MTQLFNHLNPRWAQFLKLENQLPLVSKISELVSSESKTKEVFPPESQVFRTFDLVEPENVKVIIIGQDPYHNPGQAHGLAFSSLSHPLPPSLINVFTELESDLGIIRTSGDLSDWAAQGVLLLNSTLTVNHNEPGSHAAIGWQEFTDHVIETLARTRSSLVFVLWGRHAQAKKPLVNEFRHFIIESSHPSPLSASRGFLGSRPFSQVNDILLSLGESEIEW